MRIDAVFSGGGVKAYAFLGALERMEEQDLQIVRAAGTSAGAIVAGLIAANYEISEIKDIVLNLDLKRFLDPPPLTKFIPLSKWGFLYWKMGFYRGDELERWLYNRLADKHIYTFKDIQPEHLKMVVSDLSLGKLIVIPDDLESTYGIHPDQFSVATGIRMSAGFPYFFMPKRLKGKSNCESIIVDGGLLSNFPVWIFGNDPLRLKRPILGVQLEEEDDVHHRQISNALSMLRAFFSTMKEAHDARYIDQSQINNIITIPVEHIEATDLAIDDQTKRRLIQEGYARTDQFLDFWPR
ncbi:patatin-like phospholipase family protein [Lentibacillus saliphilus]|uniref:patatin-like phospholipase family protein n=1 Tax=Lentibacillus saliphilus TaxID=2737028 RepID=UPI001C310CD9